VFNVSVMDSFNITWGFYGMAELIGKHGSLDECKAEMPTLTGLMIFLVTLQMLKILRMLAHILIFVRGMDILEWSLRKWPNLRPSDDTARREFPSYTFSFYRDRIAKPETSVNTSADDLCPICCEHFQGGDTITLLPCNIKHVFHNHCLQMWLSRNEFCPLCKSNVINI